MPSIQVYHENPQPFISGGVHFTPIFRAKNLQLCLVLGSIKVGIYSSLFRPGKSLWPFLGWWKRHPFNRFWWPPTFWGFMWVMWITWKFVFSKVSSPHIFGWAKNGLGSNGRNQLLLGAPTAVDVGHGSSLDLRQRDPQHHRAQWHHGRHAGGGSLRMGWDGMGWDGGWFRWGWWYICFILR